MWTKIIGLLYPLLLAKQQSSEYLTAVEVKSFPNLSWCLEVTYFKTQEKLFSVEFVDVQMQEGSCDCYYLLWPLSFPFVMDKIKLFYHINRTQWGSIFWRALDGMMTAFPSSASRHPKASIRKNYIILVYCICQHINDGSKMIQCDICQQWFHVACMKINKSVHQNHKSKWNCPSCSSIWLTSCRISFFSWLACIYISATHYFHYSLYIHSNPMPVEIIALGFVAYKDSCSMSVLCNCMCQFLFQISCHILDACVFASKYYLL